MCSNKMSKFNSMETLAAAELLAESRDDLNWFYQYYTNYRELYDIKTSVEMALDAMGLLKEFQTLHGVWDKNNG